jgi:hypothetical protein
MPDLLHLNAPGYRLWADVLRPTVGLLLNAGALTAALAPGPAAAEGNASPLLPP